MRFHGAELDRWADDPLSFRAPGGESGEELIARVTDFFAGLDQLRQDCVVVSHGGPLQGPLRPAASGSRSIC